MKSFAEIVLVPHYRILTTNAENYDDYHALYFASSKFTNEQLFTHTAIEIVRINLHGVIEECE